MNIAILGFGSQGASALEYWNTGEHTLTVCDNNETLTVPDGVKTKLGADHLSGLQNFDVIVRSPSVHPHAIVAANDESILDKVTTNTNEFLRVCPTKNVIGVTGTKGKGTTSTLITKMLEAVGHTVHLGGNIGTPPLQMLKDDIQPDDWVVLELANFQLIDLKHSPATAVCLMVEPEHLDWHTDIAEYYEAKAQLFKWQTERDRAVYYALNENSKNIVFNTKAKITPYYQAPGAYVKDSFIYIDDQIVCALADIKLLGQHNWQNVCAAVTAVWPIVKSSSVLKNVIATFSGLEYRLEYIRTVNDVKYYNDSFGTTPETAIVAVQAFDQPKIIVLGGSDKGADYASLAKIIHDNNVRSVISIGKTGPKITNELLAIGYKNIIDGPKTMDEIVKLIHRTALPGDVAILSTASASFDMFLNYKDRGDQFNQAVQSLA